MDVYLSTSTLEGGPIPLIETMMCNIIPVVTKTGFTQDVIQNGKNGFLFDAKQETSSICKLIEKALTLELDTRTSVLDYSWSKFANKIQKLMF